MGGGNHLYGNGIKEGWSGCPWIENEGVYCNYTSWEDVSSENSNFPEHQYVTRPTRVTDFNTILQFIREGKIIVRSTEPENKQR